MVGRESAASRPTDRSAALALAGIFFLLSIGYASGQSAGYALFVEAYGARALPFAIVLMPVVGGVITAFNLVASRRLTLPYVMVANAVAIVIVALGVRLVLATGEARPLRFVLPLWDAAVNNLDNLIVWSIASRLFDVRAAKRWAPIVASGRSLGLMTAGVVVPLAVSVVGTAGLYVLQATAFFGALGLVVRLTRGRRADLLVTEVASTSPPADRSGPYVIAIFGVVFTSMTAYVLVRNLFLDRGAALSSDPADFAGLIALIGAAQGGLTFVCAMFVGGPFLRRFGLRGGLLAFPVLLVGVYLPMSSLGLETSGQFAFAAVGYVLGGAVMHAIRTPTVQVLYQPLGAATRARAVSIAEGVVEPLALGTAAVVLLAATRLVDRGAVGMAAAIFVAGGALGIAGLGAFRRYRSELERAVSRRWFRSGGVSIDDPTTRAALCAHLEARAFPDIVAIVELLDGSPDGAEATLVELLRHPDPNVVEYSLAHLAGSTRPEVMERARALASTDSPDELRARAKQFVAASDPTAPVETWLADPCEQVATMTMAGMLGSRDDRVRARARRFAAAWAASPDARERRRLALAAGQVGRSASVPELAALLVDPARDVRVAAIEAVGRCGDTDHVEALVTELAGDDRSAAAQALSRLGAAAVEAIRDRWSSADPPLRRRLLRVVCQIDDVTATDFLLLVVDSPDAAVRHAAVRELAARSHTFADGETASRVHDEIARLTASLRAIVGRSVGSSAHAELAALVARDLIDLGRRTVAWTLTCDPVRPVSTSVATGLVSTDARQRSYSLEALELALPSALKPLVVVLMTNDDPVRVLEGLDARLPGGFATVPRPTDHPWSQDLMDETVERIITLRQVELFAGLPVETLRGIAELIAEVTLDEGAVLFQAGDIGTSMFIVASGEVRVHHGDRRLDRRGVHESFGELSLLDSAPRSASVTATLPTLLYRLDQGPFYELMSDRPEVLRRVIQGVVAMLRARLDDLARLSPEV